MTDRVDTAVNDVKPACSEPVLDEAPTQFRVEQLSPGHHPVLAPGKLGNHLVHAAI